MNINGNNLLLLREALGFSQAEVSELINISNDYISKIELGVRLNVSTKILKSLAMELETSEEWLTKNEGWAYSPSTSRKAIEFTTRQIKKNPPSEIIIITYNDDFFGTPKGFVFIGPKVSISMAGSSTRAGYYGSGPTAYKDILMMIIEAKIKVGHKELDRKDSANLIYVDLLKVARQAKYDKNFVAKELHDLRPKEFPDPDKVESVFDSVNVLSKDEMILLQLKMKESKTDIQDLIKYMDKKSK